MQLKHNDSYLVQSLRILVSKYVLYDMDGSSLSNFPVSLSCSRCGGRPFIRLTCSPGNRTRHPGRHPKHFEGDCRAASTSQCDFDHASSQTRKLRIRQMDAYCGNRKKLVNHRLPQVHPLKEEVLTIGSHEVGGQEVERLSRDVYFLCIAK